MKLRIFIKLSDKDELEVSGDTYFIRYFLKYKFFKWNANERKWILKDGHLVIDELLELLENMGLKCSEVREKEWICEGETSRKRVIDVITDAIYQEQAYVRGYDVITDGIFETRRKLYESIRRSVEKSLKNY